MIRSSSSRRSGVFAPRASIPSHRFAVGQSVRLKDVAGMPNLSERLFRVLSTLPPRDGSPQYRIRDEVENHDRVTTEESLQEAPASLFDPSRPEAGEGAVQT